MQDAHHVAIDADGQLGQNGLANTNWNVMGSVKLVGVAAGDVLKMQFRTGSGATMTVGNTVADGCVLAVRPIRVGR